MTTKSKVRIIHHIDPARVGGDQSLLTDENVSASVRKLAEMTTAALQETYPEADVEVAFGRSLYPVIIAEPYSTDWTISPALDSNDLQADVEQTINEVKDSRAWIIRGEVV